MAQAVELCKAADRGGPPGFPIRRCQLRAGHSWETEHDLQPLGPISQAKGTGHLIMVDEPPGPDGTAINVWGVTAQQCGLPGHPGQTVVFGPDRAWARSHAQTHHPAEVAQAVNDGRGPLVGLFRLYPDVATPATAALDQADQVLAQANARSVATRPEPSEAEPEGPDRPTIGPDWTEHIAEVVRVRVEPGDFLVFLANHSMGRQLYTVLMEEIANAVPEGVRWLLVPVEGVTVQHWSPSPIEVEAIANMVYDRMVARERAGYRHHSGASALDILGPDGRPHGTG